MKRRFFDSHRRFKPFEVEQLENETRRQFERRTYKMYLEMMHKYETPADGEKVYMTDVE